jgi:hypothetical protein
MVRLCPAARAALLSAATCALLAGAPATAGAETRNFLSTGAEQTFTVPAGVTSIHVIAVGASGGTGGNSPVAGGFGAVAIADVAVTPGQVLYVNVGTNGAAGTGPGGGGFNGGGGSGTPAGQYGGGGGGASDVRTISRSLGTSYFSRLITAAGGGGSGASSGGGAGGDAGQGGSNGTGANGGGPGTASAGGAGGSGGCAGNPGQLGIGGDSVGGSCTGGPPGVGGGGGGGVYGGGAGGTSSSGSGGGGGSSGFAPEATNSSVLTDSTGSPAISLSFSAPSSPGGGGTNTKPAFGAKSLVVLKLAVTRIPAGGPVAVRVVNDNAFTITGRLSGQTTGKVTVSKRLRVKLRAKAFSVGAHAKKTVKLKLPKSLRRVLKRKHKLSLRLTGTIKDPAGNNRTVRKTVKPKLKTRRRR